MVWYATGKIRQVLMWIDWIFFLFYFFLAMVSFCRLTIGATGEYLILVFVSTSTSKPLFFTLFYWMFFSHHHAAWASFLFAC